MTEAVRFNWRVPLYLSLIGSVALFAIAVCQSDISLFLNVLVVAPLLLILSVALPIFLVVRNRQQLLPATMALVLLWTIAVSLFLYSREHPFALRETARWLVWSREYKQEVLEQATPANRDFKHIEWDGFGFAGAENNVYLVFDPGDSLSKAKNNKALRFNGKPCSVWDVRRLQRHCYAVLFYTDQTWDECN